MYQKLKAYPSSILTIKSNEINLLISPSSYQEQHTTSYIFYPPFQSRNNTGRWSQDENRKFIEALFIYGNEWKKVQKYIQTRTSTQSRSHAQKFFIYFRKKYIDLYGPNELNNDANEDHLINILIDLPNCESIARFCKGEKESINEMKFLIMKQFALSDSTIDQFLFERKKKFIKVVWSLLQNSFKNSSIIHDENFNTINQSIIPKDIFTTNFIDNDTQSNNDDTFNISLDMRNFFSSNYI